MFISALLTYFGLYCSESGNTVMSTLATVTMLISVGAVHEDSVKGVGLDSRTVASWARCMTKSTVYVSRTSDVVNRELELICSSDEMLPMIPTRKLLLPHCRNGPKMQRQI